MHNIHNIQKKSRVKSVYFSLVFVSFASLTGYGNKKNKSQKYFYLILDFASGFCYSPYSIFAPLCGGVSVNVMSYMTKGQETWVQTTRLQKQQYRTRQ